PACRAFPAALAAGQYSQAPERFPGRGRGPEKGPDGLDIALGILDEAHVAHIRDDDELAALEAVVEDAGAARRRRPVVLADDHEDRPPDAREPRAVVEVAVADPREVAQHVGRADRLLAVARRH